MGTPGNGGPRATPELLARYNRPGPRYTSYPTAPQFHTGFGSREYAERLARANERGSDPLALYVHVPFCEERCLYCGCHVVITRRQDIVATYLDYLEREIERVALALPDRRSVLQLHWGGGTPTHLDVAQMRRLFDAIASRFRLLPDAEVAIEIDPRVTSKAQMDLLRELGFNRLSLGVQDFTPEVQEAVGRNQTHEQTHETFAHARGLGFDSFNIDLIYGLPRQTVESFRRSVDEVLALRPGRVAVYSYAHVPWIRPHQRRMDENDLPDTATKFALYAAAIEAFTSAGYLQIGMDHFALPDDELALAQAKGKLTRNFMGYTVRAAPDMVAFGVSGIGEVAGAFAQNAKKLTTYYAALDEGAFPVERGYVLDADDLVRRFVIQSVMCNFVLDFAELKRVHRIDFASYFARELAEMAGSIEPGFYTLGDRSLEITPLGRLFVRNICMVFDRYLHGEQGSRPIYSKTV